MSHDMNKISTNQKKLKEKKPLFFPYKWAEIMSPFCADCVFNLRRCYLFIWLNCSKFLLTWLESFIMALSTGFTTLISALIFIVWVIYDFVWTRIRLERKNLSSRKWLLSPYSFHYFLEDHVFFSSLVGKICMFFLIYFKICRIINTFSTY